MNCIYKINKNLNNLISYFQKYKNNQKFLHKIINKKNHNDVVFASNFNNELYKSVFKYYMGHINVILEIFFLKICKIIKKKKLFYLNNYYFFIYKF
jgi:hypothetical protein